MANDDEPIMSAGPENWLPWFDGTDESAKVKFNARMRLRFLERIQEHGRKELAAVEVGISLQTVQNYLKERDTDGIFAKAIELAKTLRSQRIVRTLETEAVEGILEPMVDKHGNHIRLTNAEGKEVFAYKRKVETALRIRVLERHDDAYRQKSEIEVTTKSGVLVVPKPVTSTKEWGELIANAKKESSDGE